MMMVMRLDIDAAAFSASDKSAVRIGMADVHEELRLAGAAAVGLVAAALAPGFAGCVGGDLGASDFFLIDEDHFKLRHGGFVADWMGNGQWATNGARGKAAYDRLTVCK